MNSQYVEVLRALIHKHNIKQNAIAAKAEINENTLVKVLTGKTSPTVRTLDAVLDACEEFVPGFRTEYHLALLGNKIDLDELVSSLSSNELATVLMNVSQRIRKLGLRETAIAA
jgi:transcriptional regulator with XRE-family HTH domain